MIPPLRKRIGGVVQDTVPAAGLTDRQGVGTTLLGNRSAVALTGLTQRQGVGLGLGGIYGSGRQY